MICTICKKEKGYSVLTQAQHGIVFKDVEYLEGICFVCFELVPVHIPRKQIRKWLNEKRIL